jgi:hypothetical protein
MFTYPERFYGNTEVVVIGHDPEMADMDNPRGEIYGYAGYIYAADHRGSRVRSYFSTQHCEKDLMDKMDKTAAALTARLASGKLPVLFSQWEHYRPEYGSEAYQQDGGEEELLEWERNYLGME